MFPVDGGETVRAFADIEGEEAVLVGVGDMLLGVDGNSVLGALQNGDFDTYIAVGHEITLGITHHGLIGEHVWCLCQQGKVKEKCGGEKK